jgi:Tol biopolymer transport system component
MQKALIGAVTAVLAALALLLAGCDGDPVVAVPLSLPTEITRASVSSAGAEGNGGSSAARISANGRFVLFHSTAGSLVNDDTNGYQDVFLHDLGTGTTARVSLGIGGVQLSLPSIVAGLSDNGFVVAFRSSAGNVGFGAGTTVDNLYVRKLVTGSLAWASAGIGGADPDLTIQDGTLSGDGRLAFFSTLASNIVAGDTNASGDVFVHNLDTAATTRISVPAGGGEADDHSIAPSANVDGRFVSFRNQATNLVAPFTTGNRNIVRLDRSGGTIVPVSVNTIGGEPNVDEDLSAISADGRFVAFDSSSSNLVAGDTNARWDVFVRDVAAGTTVRVSVATDGTQGNFDSNAPSISSDGRFIAFTSESDLLDINDSNGFFDVYVHDRLTSTTALVSVSALGVQGNNTSSTPRISGDGRWIAFQSGANNLVPGDTNGLIDVFVAPNPLY